MYAIDRERLLKWLQSLDSTYVRNEIIMKIESGAFDIKQPEVQDLYVDLLDKLIEVLRWYGDRETYDGNVEWDDDGNIIRAEWPPINVDNGQRARDILKEVGVEVTHDQRD